MAFSHQLVLTVSRLIDPQCVKMNKKCRMLHLCQVFTFCQMFVYILIGWWLHYCLIFIYCQLFFYYFVSWLFTFRQQFVYSLSAVCLLFVSCLLTFLSAVYLLFVRCLFTHMGLLPFWNATLVMKYSLLRLTQTTRKFQKACTVHPILAKIILLSFEQKLIMSIFLLKWKNSKTLVSLFTFFDVFGRPLCIEFK